MITAFAKRLRKLFYRPNRTANGAATPQAQADRSKHLDGSSSGAAVAPPEESSKPKSKSKPKSDKRHRDRKPNKERQPSTGNHQHRPPATARRVPPELPEIIEFPESEGQSRFTDLDIAKEVLAGAQDLGFQYCTPIQAQCLPSALGGRDVTGKAQTGTGKTAAFLIAAFTQLLRHPKTQRPPGACRVLALAPTRELAIQIHKDAEALSKYCGMRHLHLSVRADWGALRHPAWYRGRIYRVTTIHWSFRELGANRDRVFSAG